MKAWLIAGTALLGTALLSPAATARDSADRAGDETKAEETAVHHKGRGTRVRLGGITVGAGYSHFSGYPYFGPPYALWPYWGARELLLYPSYGWLGGFMHPGYYRDYREGPGMGHVKLDTAAKQALVYVDGGYAGVAKDLKSIWLRPGAYNLEVRTDQESFTQRIYVLSGKTLRIEANLTPLQEKRP